MAARDATPTSGWLPVEAMEKLEDGREAASREEADRLLALPPRDRVLELMRIAAGGGAEARLRGADLIRVLDSFEGNGAPDAADIQALLPDLFPG
jgi:hypothetical protein